MRLVLLHYLQFGPSFIFTVFLRQQTRNLDVHLSFHVHCFPLTVHDLDLYMICS